MSVNEKMTAIANTIRRHTEGTEKLTLDDIPGEIDKACVNNYEIGLEEGQALGYGHGRDDGIQEGYNYGYTVGHNEGKNEGINEGYSSATEEINTELLEVIALQESYIYPTILFYFDGMEYHVRKSEAYWTDKISFKGDWMDQPGSIWNDNGYAKWEYYSIVDSQNDLVKYNDAIKNLERYWTSGLMEFFIQCDDGNKYTVKFETWGSGVNLENITDDNRFTPIRGEYYEYSGCYFTPEENSKKYLIPVEYNYVNIGDTVYATLAEGGNE